jgi:putative salt-induced outer membrane protein YdiY
MPRPLCSTLLCCWGILAILTATLCAQAAEPSKAELLLRIKHLEEQNAKLAVDATRARMEAEQSRKLYQAAISHQEPPAPDMSAVAAKLWKAEVSLGATASSGNNNAYQVNLAAKGTRTTKIDELIMALTANVGETEGVKSSEKGKATVDYRRDIDGESRWYWLVASSLERDQLSGLDYRLTVGPGAGYRFWNTKKFKLALESGPAFVAEKNSKAEVDYSVRGRVGDRMEYQMTSYAKLFQTSEILFNLQDTEDYLVNSELGVESSLTKILSLRIFGQHRYDHVPAAGKEENDFSLISAIVYKFE